MQDQPAIGMEVKGTRACRLYEHVFLARQDLSQAQVDALAATATEIVEAGQGKVTKTETWGLKNLAFKIDRNRKAHFVLLNIEGARRALSPSSSGRTGSTKTSSAGSPSASTSTKLARR